MQQSPAIERYFVCIGAQKAGTTWLARVLSEHDEVFVTPVKEIHYFDHIAGLSDHLSARKRRSRYRKYFQRMWTQWRKWAEYRSQGDWYRAYMSGAPDDVWYAGLFTRRGTKKLAGEATPEYALIGAAGLRHLKSLAPDARVIFIMRNPVTRAWSQLLHQCRARNLDANALSVSQFLSITQEDRFEALADYPRVLDDMAAVFEPGQVLIEFYEDIHADRRAALKRICSFLGVGFDEGPHEGLDKRYNPSQSAHMPEDLRDSLRLKYAVMAREVEDRIGRVPASWTREFNLPGR